MKAKDRICGREYQGPPREFAEHLLQHTTAAIEITRDRNQEAESTEKGGSQFRVHEADAAAFPLMLPRPRLPDMRRLAPPRWPMSGIARTSSTPAGARRMHLGGTA